MPITIKNSAGGGVTLDSTTSSNETLQLPSGGGTLAPLASPVFTGNVGVGVTPEAWRANDFIGLQVGTGAAVYGRGSGDEDKGGLTSNAYYDNTNDRWQHIATKAATNYYQNAGQHTFYVAPSGTADSAISWTTAMAIDNIGATLIGSNQTNGSAAGYSRSTPHLSCSANGYASILVRRTADAGNAILFLGYSSASSAVGSIQTGSSSTTYATSSDYRLKTDVQPMTGAADRVKLLKPCNFEWIVDGTRVDGFIAHEAQEVVPEAVTGTKDAMRDEEYEVTPATDTEAAVMGTRSVPDMQGIDQSKLVPLLTATIQELIARIEALENV
jgi:hypothetical protein